MEKKALSLLLASTMLLCVPVQAGRRVIPIDQLLAEREVLTTPQEKSIRLGEDQKPRVIITSDLEIDDMNSFIHQCLYFNEMDLAGIVVSASFCHFTGDGVHTQKEVMDHIQNREEGALDMTSFRPQPLDWLPNLWQNEYAEAYEFLSQNDPAYPSPEYLTSITKIGNVQFEGDVREDTEGSNLIKEAILDDDERNLFILTWGGFNTVARALLSIHEEYGETDQWEEIYEKVCNKVILRGNGQDFTYTDFIVPIYPDLVVMNSTCAYEGYNAGLNAQIDARYTFQADWLKENIKFDHGSLMGIYKLVNDGQHIEGEEDQYQFGETNLIYGKENPDYNFIAEGDSISVVGIITMGLRGFENGHFGSYGGRLFYTKANGEDAGYATTLPGGIVPTGYINPETGSVDRYNPCLLDMQMEWAARADWCVGTYEECNHAPSVKLEQQDFTVKAGDRVDLAAILSDPDGDEMEVLYSLEPTGNVYAGDLSVFDWRADTTEASFTVPADAVSGDSFCITLTVRDKAEAPMTRYAQAFIQVE